MAKMTSDEEWLQVVSESATPIDLEALINQGILRRRSQLRFDVLDPKRVPKHVWRQARAIETATRKGETRTTITLSDNTKSMKRLLVKTVGERRAEELISKVSGRGGFRR